MENNFKADILCLLRDCTRPNRVALKMVPSQPDSLCLHWEIISENSAMPV